MVGSKCFSLGPPKSFLLKMEKKLKGKIWHHFWTEVPMYNCTWASSSCFSSHFFFFLSWMLPASSYSSFFSSSSSSFSSFFYFLFFLLIYWAGLSRIHFFLFFFCFFIFYFFYFYFFFGFRCDLFIYFFYGHDFYFLINLGDWFFVSCLSLFFVLIGYHSLKRVCA